MSGGASETGAGGGDVSTRPGGWMAGGAAGRGRTGGRMGWGGSDARTAPTEAVDEPAAGRHADRVTKQVRRVDETHPHGVDAVVRDDPFGAGHRDTQAVEVTDGGAQHEQGDDAPRSRSSWRSGDGAQGKAL